MKTIKHHIQVIILQSRIKDYNIMIDSKNFFDQPINSELKEYGNIIKIATGKGDDYTTGFLLDYFYFKENYMMIAINLSNQQTLDADPRAVQQINFTENLDRAGNTTMFFIIEEAKETVLDFSQGTVSFVNVILLNAKCNLILINIKMTQYNSLNVKLSNSQLNKLKPTIKNETEVVLRLSSNMIGDNESNFPHKLLLTNRQVATLPKAIANH